MGFFRLENALGVFLLNGKVAGTSGGPVTGHLSLVTGRRKEPAAGGFFFYGKQLLLYDFRPALADLSEVRHKLVGDKQDGPAFKPNKADV